MYVSVRVRARVYRSVCVSMSCIIVYVYTVCVSECGGGRVRGVILRGYSGHLKINKFGVAFLND